MFVFSSSTRHHWKPRGRCAGAAHSSLLCSALRIHSCLRIDCKLGDRSTCSEYSLPFLQDDITALFLAVARTSQFDCAAGAVACVRLLLAHGASVQGVVSVGVPSTLALLFFGSSLTSYTSPPTDSQQTLALSNALLPCLFPAT